MDVIGVNRNLYYYEYRDILCRFNEMRYCIFGYCSLYGSEGPSLHGFASLHGFELLFHDTFHSTFLKRHTVYDLFYKFSKLKTL